MAVFAVDPTPRRSRITGIRRIVIGLTVQWGLIVSFPPMLLGNDFRQNPQAVLQNLFI